MEILQRCDGTITVAEIAEQLLHMRKDYDREQILESVLLFLTEAWQKGIVQVQSSPARNAVNCTGSTEYYIPLHMAVELTLNCNLRCIYCYRDAGPAHAERLPTDQLLSILQELSCAGVRGVELTGGEPLIHPDFPQILDNCANQFNMLTLLTNGCLIDEDLAIQIASYREKLVVQIDLDGSTPEVHDHIRGQAGAFKKAKQAISLLAKHQVRTRVVMNVIPFNANDVEKTLLLARELGATSFTYSHVLDVGRGKDIDLQFTAEQAENLGYRLRKYFQEKYEGFYFVPPPDLEESFWSVGNCGLGHRSIVLGPTGKVRPCLLLPEEYLVIGDLSRDPIEKVFADPVITFLSNIRAPNQQECGDCPYVAYCMYCITRAIFAQQKRGQSCQWFQTNQVGDWVYLVNREGSENRSSMLCPQVAHHDPVSEI
jgi:radical SAM protein with 4Fe4S-binding SPASM domain